MSGADNNANNSQSIADYLAQLLKDRNKVNAFPNVFIHVERLIDEGKFWIGINLRMYVFWGYSDSQGIT